MMLDMEAPFIPPAVDIKGVTRRFGSKVALDRVTVQIPPGEIHALLGPNGAGKTTLLRIVSGLTEPSSGTVSLMGHGLAEDGVLKKRLIGVVPSTERSFYYRISGLENLIFFARLHGMTFREAADRARRLLEEVDLADAMRLPVGQFSHGMQSRLSVARALLTDPPVLLVDEATHDLDPGSARRTQELIRAAARRGTAVIWATQRVDEIRGFAARVTMLSHGTVRFSGSVPGFMSHSVARKYLLRLRNGPWTTEGLQAALGRAIGEMGTIAAHDGGDSGHYVLALADGIVLGDALAALTAAHVQVLACQEERPEIEEAFLRLTEEGGQQ
jgi:ABC-2 type transport system ATP-binding protein